VKAIRRLRDAAGTYRLVRSCGNGRFCALWHAARVAITGHSGHFPYRASATTDGEEWA